MSNSAYTWLRTYTAEEDTLAVLAGYTSRLHQEIETNVLCLEEPARELLNIIRVRPRSAWMVIYSIGLNRNEDTDCYYIRIYTQITCGRPAFQLRMSSGDPDIDLLELMIKWLVKHDRRMIDGTEIADVVNTKKQKEPVMNMSFKDVGIYTFGLAGTWLALTLVLGGVPGTILQLIFFVWTTYTVVDAHNEQYGEVD